jgi:hypothetical protein
LERETHEKVLDYPWPSAKNRHSQKCADHFGSVNGHHWADEGRIDEVVKIGGVSSLEEAFEL